MSSGVANSLATLGASQASIAKTLNSYTVNKITRLLVWDLMISIAVEGKTSCYRVQAHSALYRTGQ